MKKILLFVFVISILSLSVVGCKKNEDNNSIKEETVVVPTEQEKTKTEPVIPTEPINPTPVNPTEPVDPTPVVPTEPVTPTVEPETAKEAMQRVKDLSTEYKNSDEASIQIILKNGDEERIISLSYKYKNEKLDSLSYEISGDTETKIYLRNNTVYTLIDNVTSQEAFNNSSNKLISDAINELYETLFDLLEKHLQKEDLDFDDFNIMENDEVINSVTLYYGDNKYATINYYLKDNVIVAFPENLDSYGE